MNVLVINAGSSSLKYQLIDMSNESVLAKGNAERIGIAGSKLVQKAGDDTYTVETPMKDHVEAMKQVLSALTERKVVKDMSSIGAVGHRVVHGGEKFAGSVLIDASVMDAIRENVDLAPLHNPANIQGIEACQGVMPTTPMVAVFDTAFHQTMPRQAYLYGLPYEMYTEMKIRRYGFHGTSHLFVSREAAKLMGKPVEQLKIVTCHLGNGSSIAAVDGGKSVDTSMGLTPLEGVMMGTRSGDIDPAIIEFLMKKKGMAIDQVMAVLNKQSGLQGVSGETSDMRDIEAAIAAGKERAAIAFEVFCYKVKKYVGAYAAAMGGLDGVVFTAGIGENTDTVREKVTEGLGFLGVNLDKEVNKGRRAQGIISTPDSRVTVMIINTNEELTIARDTLALVK